MPGPGCGKFQISEWHERAVEITAKPPTLLSAMCATASWNPAIFGPCKYHLTRRKPGHRPCGYNWGYLLSLIPVLFVDSTSYVQLSSPLLAVPCFGTSSESEEISAKCGDSLGLVTIPFGEENSLEEPTSGLLCEVFRPTSGAGISRILLRTFGVHPTI